MVECLTPDREVAISGLTGSTVRFVIEQDTLSAA